MGTSCDYNHFYIGSQKRIHDINDCNIKKDYQIVMILGRNIPDTTGHIK